MASYRPKVGDVVRVVRIRTPWTSLKVGELVQITGPNPDSLQRWVEEYPNNWACEVEPVAPDEEAAWRLTHG